MKTSPQRFCLAILLSGAALLPPLRLAQAQAGDRTAVFGNAEPARRFAPNDAGPVSPNLLMPRLTIVLRPGAERRMALARFLADLENPSSPDYRRWLSPEEFGNRFGAPQADAQRIAAWLQAQGMTNVRVARGRMFINFSGTAGAVQAAFHTALHTYSVHGQSHYANQTAPSIPIAFSGMIADVIGLHNFNPDPQLIHASSLPAQSALGSGQNYLGPDDLAAIYNMKPLYAQGIAGSGITVAILGQTPIGLSDYRAYRQRFGLAANDFQTLAVPGSGNGTNATADLEEAALDTETLGAVARNSTILYVWGATVIDAAQYVVENQLAQVMSLSYAGCENGGALSYQAIAQQANAEGITWINAAGDSGAAGCDPMLTPAATNGLSVTNPASVPEVTAVGGTAFANGSSGQYWNSTNAPYGASALAYVPETGWSDPNAVLGGGGGVSRIFPPAGYQSDFDTSGASGRMVPDVSLASALSPVPYLIVSNGSSLLVGGTSAATPVFAGIAALVNQYLAATSQIAQPGLGNMNPKLYLLAEKMPDVFHDVASGSNLVPCAPGTPDCVTGTLGYSAASGYDQATGLGSVDAFALASNWDSVTLGQADVKLASSAAQTQASQSLTFTASVRGEQSVANSPVTFYYSNPQTQAGAVSFRSAITDATGTATVGSNIFAAGSNTVTAVFEGSTTVAPGARSNPVTIAVSAFPTSTEFATGPGLYHAGQSAVFSVTVSAPPGVALGGPDPTDQYYAPGSVFLYSSDGTLQAQSPVAADGSASLISKALVAGNNIFYASYPGNAYAASSRSSALTLAAAAEIGTGTTTTLTASFTHISFGSSILLTAQVSGPAGVAVPTGTAMFYNGTAALASAPLDASGSAAITVVPAIGTASMTAVYSGNGALNSSTSAPLAVTVGNMVQGDFTISGPTSTTMAAGSSTAITLALTPLNGFTGTILLSCTGLPGNDHCTLPATLTPQGTTSIPVTIATCQATLVAGVPFALFCILLAPGTLRRRKIAALAALALVLAFLSGCAGSVNAGSPQASSSNAPAGNFTATITAASGSISHQFQINITVEN